MANGHGGPRTPANPAAVSGPGSLSARTDGRPGTQPIRDLPDADYGEGAEFREIQQGSPLARVSASGPRPVDMSGVTGLDAPSAQPDVPVTAGAALGAGPGASALGLPTDPVELDRADVRRLAATGALQAMIAKSERDDATPSFRRYVRKVIAKL